MDVIVDSEMILTPYYDGIIKLDSQGDSCWFRSKKFMGVPTIQQTSDGGYIVSSTDTYVTNGIEWMLQGENYLITKLTPEGEISWEKYLGAEDEDCATSIRQTSDGGYIVAGYSNSEFVNNDVVDSDDNFWIVKLEAE